MVNFYPRLGVLSPFDPSLKYVTSPVRLLSPQVLACIRLLLAFYTFFTLLFKLVWEGTRRTESAQAFFSYFTHLSYIGLCAYFFNAGIHTAFYAFKKKYVLQKRWPRFLQFLHVLLTATIVTYPFIVTIVFWALLSSSSIWETSSSAWSNISVHAFNLLFALFEILLTNIPPSPWLTLPFVLLMLGAYVGVVYITYATQGFYTYSFLDPEDSGRLLAVYVVGIAVGQCIIFVFARGLVLLRQRLTRKIKSSSSEADGSSSETDEMREALDEWQAVEKPSSTAEVV